MQLLILSVPIKACMRMNGVMLNASQRYSDCAACADSGEKRKIGSGISADDRFILRVNV